MAKKDMMYPDPKIPLTPGQIVKLGGVFVDNVKYFTKKGVKMAEYEIPQYVWIDPCKNLDRDVRRYKNFTKYFNIIEKKAVTYVVVPKLDKINEIVYVPAVPSVWLRTVKGGLFWFKVPTKLYHEVIKAGEQIDKYYRECRKKRRMKVRQLESEIHIDLSDKSINKLAEAISASLSKVLTEVIASVVKELASTQMEYQMPKKVTEEEMKGISLLNKLRKALIAMRGVIDVRIAEDKITVFCDKNAIPEVKDVLNKSGLEVFDIKTLEYIGIVKARLRK